MFSKYTFWLWTAAIIQLATAGIHMLVVEDEFIPRDAAGTQLHELMRSYEVVQGEIFSPSMHDFMTALSACFTLLYFLGGLINIHLLRKEVPAETMKGVTGINTMVAGISFLVMLSFTYMPSIILTLLVFLSLCLAYATNHIHLLRKH